MVKQYPAFTSVSLVEYAVCLGALAHDTKTETRSGMLPTKWDDDLQLSDRKQAG